MHPVAKLIRRWSYNAEAFVHEALRVERISTQQQDALTKLSILVAAKMKRSRKEVLTDAEEAFVRKDGMSIMSGKGCHARGTPIMMANGHVKPVEEVHVGDRLMGDDGTERRVLSLARGRQQMYRVAYRDGTHYDVNEEHLLCLRHDGGKRKVMSVKQLLALTPGARRKLRGYRAAVEFPTGHQLKIPPYILGAWLGDGSKDRASFYNIDKPVIDEIAAFARERGLTYSVRIVKEHHVRAPRGRRNSFMTDLRHYGLLNNKHIPHPYRVASRAERLELLAGLIDTDGTLDRRGKRVVSIIQKSRALADDIQFLARSLGIHCTLRPVRKRWQNGVGDYFELTLTRNVELIPTRIARKRARCAHRRPFGLNFEITVTKLGVDRFYGFSLTGNGQFLLGDCTVTHNTGKDAFAAWAILWFLICMPRPKVPCTAPTSHQLSDVLWSELNKWLRHSSAAHRELKSGFYIDEWLTWTAEKLYFTEMKGAQWFAVARTTNVKASAEQQAETLQGFHEDFMMLVLDEASGLPDPVFKPLETTMTGAVNFAVLIFNPTRPTGFAIDSHKKFREHWICLQWNAEKSENVAKDQIEKLAKKYGRDSNMYRISVLGIPPKADPDMLIPWDWAFEAIDRDIEPAEDDPLILTIDPGGSGENADLTAMALARGNKVLHIREFRSIDTEQIANWAMHVIFSEEPMMVIVDIIGIGQGVYDKLRHRVADCNIVGLNVGELASNDDRYPRLRDELWCLTRELFEQRAISIPDDPDLLAELTNLKAAPNDDGRMKVEGKRELKARGVSSPNKADCIMMLAYFSAAHRRKMTGPRRNRRSAVADSWRTV